MAEIEFLLLEQKKREPLKKRGKQKHRIYPVRLQEEIWHGFSLRLHWMDAECIKCPQRVYAYVEKQKKNDMQLWTDCALDPILKGGVQPLPSPQLAYFLLKNQPFRQTMIFHRGRVPWEFNRFWQKRFLEQCFGKLNGLYLLGDSDTDESFLDSVYNDSGLAAVVTCKIPDLDGTKCVFVEIDSAENTEYRKMPFGCLYLDLTSNREKQRYLAVKRTDISYMSARNFLDTALKARYNAT